MRCTCKKPMKIEKPLQCTCIICERNHSAVFKVHIMTENTERLRKIKRDNQQKLKKEYSKYKKKQKLIADIKKIQKVREKLKPKPSKPKSFKDYFQECIKNKTIPPMLPLIFVKFLSELSRSMTKES